MKPRITDNTDKWEQWKAEYHAKRDEQLWNRVKALWWEAEVKYNIRKGESDEHS